MSDHEAVTFEVNLNPIRNRKPPHKVFKYKSADWCKLKNEISKMTDEYFDTDPNSQEVNTNWIFFRDNLKPGVHTNDFAPIHGRRARIHTAPEEDNTSNQQSTPQVLCEYGRGDRESGRTR